MIGVSLQKYDSFPKIIDFSSHLINFLISLHCGKQATSLQSVPLLIPRRLNGPFSKLVVMGMLLPGTPFLLLLTLLSYWKGAF